jgi:tetratricopeptide (TPR) repeat protein
MISHRALGAFERGDEWEARGNTSKAISAYREAIAIEPSWVDPHRRLGVIFFDLHRYDEAAATFRQARPLVPAGDGSVDDMLYVIERIQSGELNKAAYDYFVTARDLPDDQLDEKIGLCRQALSLNPGFAAPYEVLGKALLAKGSPNQARAVLERGLACETSPFTRAMLLFDLGNVLLIAGQRDKALQVFRQAVDLNANPTATQFAGRQLEAAASGRI